jgi:hypothetical protein
MAIARGAGTEIIRTAKFADVDSTETTLITGVQHHIYTVLSIVVQCESTATPGTNKFYLKLVGYDAKGGSSGADNTLLKWVMVNDNTFVWNDKFSFTGTEPSSNSQDAHADQGTTTAQLLKMNTTAAADNCTVIITYIDQNNA